MVKFVSSNAKNPEAYVKSYKEFRGVDYSTDPTQVADNRSPDAVNLISDLDGFPEKRTGWRILHTLPARINGIFYSVTDTPHTYVHAGTILYELTDVFTQVGTGLADSISTAFTHKGKFYILDGTTYMCINDGVLEPVTGFIPTTVIGCTPSGGGTAFEAVNLISNYRKNSFAADGTSTAYHLDSTGVSDVSAIVNGTAVTSFTVSGGVVTFSTAPPVSDGGAGIDNVIITFRKDVDSSAINKCTICAFYGYNNDNRIFLSGNPDHKNTDWKSGLDDPTYFPDNGYTKIGADTSAIMGYIKQYDSMVIVKESNEQDAEIFLRTATMYEDGTIVFPVKQGVKGVGAVSKRAFGSLRDDPLFLSNDGVYAVASTTVTQSRATQGRSHFINAKLKNEANLNTAVSAVWNGFYILCINDHCYVADARQKTATAESYGYEWYYWNNIPARVFLEKSGTLYFGDSEGNVCRFNDDLTGMNKYSDDDEPIFARWSTKADMFGTFMRRKTLKKRGAGVLIKPYTRSSVNVYTATESTTKRLLTTGTMDILNFADIDFERFTFNAMDTPQVKPFGKKVKKFIWIQFIFENDTVNEGFGVYGCEVKYSVAGEVKR